jgi:hypothetical protein
MVHAAEVGSEARQEDMPVVGERMLMKTALLNVEVDDVKTAAAQAVVLIKDAGGYVENSSVRGEKSASLTLRVPSDRLDAVLDGLAGLGRELDRKVAAQDVTEIVLDLEAKLKNKIALRDRLRALLEKATNVNEVLVVEEQLTRIQSEIDSMEGRLKHLKGRVRLSIVTLELRRTRILGPLGYLGKGLVWLVSKLFVIQ